MKALDNSQDSASKPSKRLEKRKEYTYERKSTKVQPVQKKASPITPKKPLTKQDTPDISASSDKTGNDSTKKGTSTSENAPSVDV